MNKIVQEFGQLLRDDSEIAWGWHCNIACAAIDEGVSHEIANRTAARFMQTAFQIDMTQSEDYQRYLQFYNSFTHSMRSNPPHTSPRHCGQ